MTTVDPPRRGAAAKGGATRAMIVDTAIEIFGETGYLGTSLRDIAARCGLTHPGLLYHFPTKEALLMAALTRRDEQDGVDNPTHGRPGRDTLASLVRTARVNARRRGIVELYATLSAESTHPGHPAHAYFQDRYRSLLADLTLALEDLAQAGELRAGVRPDVAARQIVAVMDGLQVQWLLDGGATDMAGALADFLDRLLVAPLEA
ncbi:TetR/AcrR family transcriptional regulator [Demequina sp. NBRC 110052]|uniref:TetR/AcrR family transcriptional regulator n=1 Tax=Demequina sp. NBRC 110052 TaxID=1570341 RepID=UPI0009FDD830|nr:TetR/AcrR family transcriptional regulator [Demequina sp. NBRC 110052]